MKNKTMERKIGEIFEYNGEWYQCMGGTCRNCSFYYDTVCKNITAVGSTTIGNCHCSLRTDHKSVIFKKLEKVGGTYAHNSIIVQKYRISAIPVTMPNEPYMYFNAINNTIEIEIKQNKEDMEENKLNLKPFDIQKAREGYPVCTRDGRKARIICFDAEGDKPLIVLSKINGQEVILRYTKKGQSDNFHSPTPREDDLMMLLEKKEGWVNVYKASLYDTKDEALIGRSETRGYIDTVKIEWEE